MSSSKDTSWGNVASWYEGIVNDPDSYQQHVIKPGILNLLGEISNKTVIDIGCGTGFYTKLLADLHCEVIATDIGTTLLTKTKELVPEAETFEVSADMLSSVIKPQSIDAAICILALQNIRPWQAALSEMYQVLKKDGVAIIVLNHPTFRIPGGSSWEYDRTKNVQYRRIERYISKSEHRIDMSPGEKDKDLKQYTVSFHWPLSEFTQSATKAGFVIDALEEWTSHKKTEAGVRKAAEDTARKEIPLFIAIRLRKI